MYRRRAAEAEPSPAPRALCAAAILRAGALLLALALLPAGRAEAKIYFRSASSATTASGSSLSLEAPAGTAAGDFLIMNVDSNGGATAFTAPAGWTSLSASTNYSGNALGGGYSILAYKLATAADVGASYTVSLGATRAAVGRIVAYVGVEAGKPIENSFPAGTDPNGGTSATTFSYPSVTTTAANTMVVVGAIAFPTGAATTFTPPAGSSKRVSVSVTGTTPDISAEVDDFVQATAGTVAKTGTIATSSPWGAGTIALTPASSGALQFDIAPEPPGLGKVTLSGGAQTSSAKMNNFAVDNTGSESGWNLTVAGATGAGRSPVFKQYCEAVKGCSGTADEAYVSGGFELPAGSLQLDSKTASWSTTGGAGAAPVFQCGLATCPLDAATPTKIVSAASGAGLGPWSVSGFKAGSLTLSTPSTLRALPANESYRVDLLWTLSSGP